MSEIRNSEITASKYERVLHVWEPVIGLEVHVQLLTESKMFCGCATVYGDPPNSHTCPVCLGLPGALPVPNTAAVDIALRLGEALGCDITRTSRFARKHYFYPDLPKGYQISQYDEPLCRGGRVTFRTCGAEKVIRLVRIHLEEDAGKSLHNGGAVTLLDFNRCGIPLVEIVTEPDFRSPAEARDFLARLRQILLYLGVSACNMEEGNLRCDANVSLRRRGIEALGVRTEIKNMNSMRGVERALSAEVLRHAEILLSSRAVEQATLLWNEKDQTAEVMRGKEESHDYRYFSDPDLVPLVISDEWLARVRRTVTELPDARERRLVTDFGLRAEDANILCAERDLADYFEETVLAGANPAEAARWIIGEVLRWAKELKRTMKGLPVAPGELAAFLRLVATESIAPGAAKEVLEKMMASGVSAEVVIAQEGLGGVAGEEEGVAAVREVLHEHPSEVLRFRQGKVALFGFLMGQVMKRLGGKGNPQAIRQLLQKALEDSA